MAGSVNKVILVGSKIADPDNKPEKKPRDVFVYIIHEGKLRAPQGAMALMERVK